MISVQPGQTGTQATWQRQGRERLRLAFFAVLTASALALLGSLLYTAHRAASAAKSTEQSGLVDP